MKFTDLALAAPIFRVLERQGYTAPTPIQGQAITPILEGHDILGIAQTGTGKTAAFALPILTRLYAEKAPAQRRTARVLVLSPTRELAAQIAESFTTYGEGLGLSVACVFGGVAHGPQREKLSRGVDVLVATPGRLLDHMGERNLDLSGTGIFVLDEADQMLDLGFVVPIRRIVAQMPTRRQSLFFSATMPREIAALAGELLRDPIKIAVAPVATTVERVEQEIIFVEAAKKKSLLAVLLADEAMSRTIVFTRTKRGADKVASHLEDCGINAAAIHGNKSQRQREATLEQFKRGKIRVLVATDIAARGIDIDSVSHVVNFELPEVPEAYVHRIGRTARAGADGRAISLVDNSERDLLRSIEKLTRQQITAQDRRNDNTLVAAAKTPSSAGSDRDSRSDRGRSGGGDRKFSDRPRGDRAGGARAGGDRGGDRKFGDRKFGGSSSGYQSGPRSDRPTGSRPARDAASGDRPAWTPVDKTYSERVADGGVDRPVNDRPTRTDDRPASGGGERKFSDRPRGEFRPRPQRDDRAPRGDRPSGDRPSGDRPSGDRPSGDRPSGDRPFRERSSGDRPFGDRAASPRSSDTAPRGEFRPRPPRDDREPRGDRPTSDRPTGGRPFRERPAGDRPTGDRKFGGPRSDFRDRPQRDDRGPRSDRPTGDRPPGDRPFRERPTGDRPSGDRKFGGPRSDFRDRPQRDDRAPRADRAASDRPAGGERPTGDRKFGGPRSGPRSGPSRSGPPRSGPPRNSQPRDGAFRTRPAGAGGKPLKRREPAE